MFVVGGPVLSLGQTDKASDASIFVKLGGLFVTTVASGIALILDVCHLHDGPRLRNQPNKAIDADEQDSNDHKGGEVTIDIHNIVNLGNDYLFSWTCDFS